MLGQVPFIAIGLCRLLEFKRIFQLTALTLALSFLFVTYLTMNSLIFDPLTPSISVNAVPVEAGAAGETAGDKAGYFVGAFAVTGRF